MVAYEVRNLAMRAADAAKNTGALIETTVKQVLSGKEILNRTNENFLEVSRSIKHSEELIEEISQASLEQSQGIGQINKAIGEMDKVVQQTAANAEESASASEEMSSQALNLRNHVFELVDLLGEANDDSKGKGITH